MSETTRCPCSSGKAYTECCEPYISGSTRAPGPQALMRSRYTAYATGNIPYLAETLHPSQRHDYDEAAAEKWAQESAWEGLEIVDVMADIANANSGKVEFRATYRRNGETQVHHELAEFRKSGGAWYFFDGKIIGPGQYTRDVPKVGRNDPCPCDSGKKFKKCCGP